MMSSTLICERCEQETARASANQKYCEDCRKANKARMIKAANDRAKAKRKAGIRPPSKGGPPRMVHCKQCGDLIKVPYPSQKYCDNCREKAREEKEKRKAEREKAMEEREAEKRENAKPKALPKKDYAFLTPSAAPEGWSLAGKSADQVMIEARALGLSYGQYSSFVSSGFIERYCRDNSVDGLAVTKKAWEEFRRHQKKLRTGKSE